ncbi:MAG: sigma-70 family RNA polymerase sigma factor [Chloroflexota bacterium]|nr:sigma-70 family RNA polymerase sigma factor [Chloroflexota bacterium]
MVEEEIIRRAVQGDLDCFNQLVELYQRPVYNLCLRMLSDSGAADDAAQETFISAYRAICRFRGGSFKAWLFRIASNACYDQLRALRRRRTTPLDDLTLEMESPLPTPEDCAIRHEMGEEIKRALDALPHEQRLAVILRDIEGLDYTEIAQAIGCSLGTVKSRINRGRAGLRDILRHRRELLT